MKVQLTLICLLACSFACTGTNEQAQSNSHAQNTQTATAPASKPSGPGFEISATITSRVNQWKPDTSEISGITLTKGATMKMINGNIAQFEAEPGYELALVRVDAKRSADNATARLETVSVEDTSGKKIPSLTNKPKPLGGSVSETREFAFAVPKGTALKKIQLTESLSAELK